jgi:ParB family chromosome partitioning protein
MESASNVRKIEIERLDPNPFQPRIEYPPNELEELGMSMLKHGQLQPIIVRPKGNRYEVAAGWGRVMAAKRTGIRDLLCVIRDLSDEQMIITALVENLQRRNLNPVEEARGFRMLHVKGWTQEQIAKEVGRGLTRDTVAQRLRLLSFPTELQELVSHDTITATHAEALARLADKPSLLKQAIGKVVDGKLTTKQTEQLIDQLTRIKGDREIMRNYLTSRDSLLSLLRYIFANLPRDDQTCPICYGSANYDDSDDKPRVFCNDCGFSLDVSLLINGESSVQ